MKALDDLIKPVEKILENLDNSGWLWIWVIIFIFLALYLVFFT